MTLRLSLHGGATWSADARRGQLAGLRMSLDGNGVSLMVKRATSIDPTELMLYLERHRTLDVARDTVLLSIGASGQAQRQPQKTCFGASLSSKLFARDLMIVGPQLIWNQHTYRYR